MADERDVMAEREFDGCEADHFGWDGYHLEDAVRFARMFRRQRDALREDFRLLSDAVNQSTTECGAACTDYGHGDDCPSCNSARWLIDQQRELTALRQQLTEAQAELISAQCGYCKQGDRPRRVDNHMNFGPPIVWTHNDERFLGDCGASRIHEYLHQQRAARLASSSEKPNG